MYIHFADRISIGAVFIRINSHDYCTMHITGRIVKKNGREIKRNEEPVTVHPTTASIEKMVYETEYSVSFPSD